MHGAAQADVVIEAIFENLEAKHALLRQLDAVMRPDAVLATNTSSLRLEDLRTVLQRPERLVGIHFFNPVALMPLVEVVAAEGGDPAVVQAACAFVRQIDKLPLPVRSEPGFLVNAVLAPYMLEAMRAVDEGIAPETVDEAMLAFGMPMGPIELVDTVGLDIAMAAGQQLAGGAEPPRCLLARAEKKQLGKKSGQGFYAWRDGKAAEGSGGDAAGRARRAPGQAADRSRRTPGGQRRRRRCRPRRRRRDLRHRLRAVHRRAAELPERRSARKGVAAEQHRHPDGTMVLAFKRVFGL